jgi:Domain of unknown function (DUF4349)
MTAAELTAQIRTARPVSPAPLRARVAAIAKQEAAPRVGVRLRLPRLRVLVSVVAAAAVAAAAAIALVRPQAQQQPGFAAQRQSSTTSPGVATPTGSASSGAAVAPAPLQDSAPAGKTAAPLPPTGRATRYTAQLTISVKNGAALSDATTRAQGIVRELGGYVVNVSFASSDSGAASLTLRVPTTRVQDGLAQLTALGRVVSQQVQIDDLQSTLDQLARRLTVLEARIAHITAMLTDTTLTAVRRADLVSQRTGLQNALRAARQSRSSTAREARFATIGLQLQTAAKAVAPPPSRASRILHRAGRILAWEGAALLYLLVVAGPFALVAAAFTLAARARRHAGETRLLARS